MLKSGLIVGVAALVFGFAATFVTPLCAPCVALFAGLGAGYLAALFDKPASQDAATKAGASAGAVAAVLGLVGNMIAAVVNSIVVGPAGAAQMAQTLGLPTGGDPQVLATSYYASAYLLPCCIALFDVGLMAGLGALGGMLWHRMNVKQPGSV